jgi:hypothetical protein
VIFDGTGNKVANKEVVGGVFHGHVRTWDELDPAMRKLLEERGVVKTCEIHSIVNAETAAS